MSSAPTSLAVAENSPPTAAHADVESAASRLGDPTAYLLRSASLIGAVPLAASFATLSSTFPLVFTIPLIAAYAAAVATGWQVMAALHRPLAEALWARVMVLIFGSLTMSVCLWLATEAISLSVMQAISAADIAASLPVIEPFTAGQGLRLVVVGSGLLHALHHLAGALLFAAAWWLAVDTINHFADHVDAVCLEHEILEQVERC